MNVQCVLFVVVAEIVTVIGPAAATTTSFVALPEPPALSTKRAVWYVPAAEYVCVVVPVVFVSTAPSPNAQKRFTGEFVDVSVNVAAWPGSRAGRRHRVGRDGGRQTGRSARPS